MDQEIEKKFIVWMVGKRGNKPSTARTYLNNIRLFQRKYRDLDQICHDDIVNYLADLKIKQNKNANTRRLKKVSIETFFEWYSDFVGTQNPAIGLDQIKEYKKIPNLIHPNEVEAICFYEHQKNTDISMRNAAIIAYLAMVGPRIGEFEQLKLGNIIRKPDSYEVIIPAQKGTYERLVQFGKFIPGTLVDYFNRYYLWVTTIKMQKKANPLFFKMTFRKLHQENLTRPVLRGSVNYLLKRAAYNAGVDLIVTAHSLRHFYGTFSIIEGLNPFILQQNMGHARFETTQKYIHLAGLMTNETLKHSPASKIKSSFELREYTELMKDLNKYID